MSDNYVETVCVLGVTRTYVVLIVSLLGVTRAYFVLTVGVLGVTCHPCASKCMMYKFAYCVCIMFVF